MAYIIALFLTIVILLSGFAVFGMLTKSILQFLLWPFIQIFKLFFHID